MTTFYFSDDNILFPDDNILLKVLTTNGRLVQGDDMALKKHMLIEKRNVLNEIRANSMSLQELRFFSIYLAKINARDVTTRVVRFSLPEFRRIMTAQPE